MNRLLRPLLATAVLVALAPVPADAFSTVSGVRVNAVEARLLALINQARTSRGIPALVITPGTTDVARRWSSWQAAHRSLEHNPNLVAAVQAAGSPDWRALAENVGNAWSTGADQLFSAYMNSSGHRANILNRAYRYIGLGWAELPDGSGYNTQVFVDRYTTSYGRVREPAYGGLADRRGYTATAPLADFENGWDPRALPATTGSGLWSGGLSVDARGIGDQAARFTVREMRSGTGGTAELRLRDAVDLSRASGLALRVGAVTGTGRPVVIDVYLRRDFGDTVRVGSVTIRHGQTVSVVLSLPAAGRSFRNQVVLAVSRASLQSLNPSSLTGRWATLVVRDVTIRV